MSAEQPNRGAVGPGAQVAAPAPTEPSNTDGTYRSDVPFDRVGGMPALEMPTHCYERGDPLIASEPEEIGPVRLMASACPTCGRTFTGEVLPDPLVAVSTD